MSQYYSQVKNPVWANEAKTLINCDVDFGHLDNDFVPFTADPKDNMEYSQTIFNECLSGKYGPIGEYVAPMMAAEIPPPTKEELLAQIRELTAKVEAL